MNVRDGNAQDRVRTGCSNGVRLFSIIFLLMVISVMVTGGLVVLKWMNNVSRLPLSKLVVTGQLHYTTHDDIRQAILSLGSPGTFMMQDVNVIQQQIERLPWIKQVSVRKQWPDELKVHLVEYKSVARWNDSHMVDSDGISFNVPVDHIGKEVLTMLYGPEGSEKEVLNGYHSINKILKNNQIKLKIVSMAARRSWQLVISDGVRIELGRSDIIKRLNRFIELYPVLQQQGKNENKRLNSVDLRYESGASVGWHLE